jgi:hypothetical protein
MKKSRNLIETKLALSFLQLFADDLSLKLDFFRFFVCLVYINYLSCLSGLPLSMISLQAPLIVALS